MLIANIHFRHEQMATKIFLSFTEAADQLKPRRPTLISTRNHIIIGVTAAVALISVVFFLWVVLRKKLSQRHLYADVEMLSVSEKQTGTDRILCAGPTLDQSESSVTSTKNSELL